MQCARFGLLGLAVALAAGMVAGAAQADGGSGAGPSVEVRQRAEELARDASRRYDELMRIERVAQAQPGGAPGKAEPRSDAGSIPAWVAAWLERSDRAYRSLVRRLFSGGEGSPAPGRAPPSIVRRSPAEVTEKGQPIGWLARSNERFQAVMRRLSVRQAWDPVRDTAVAKAPVQPPTATSQQKTAETGQAARAAANAEQEKQAAAQVAAAQAAQDAAAAAKAEREKQTAAQAAAAEASKQAEAEARAKAAERAVELQRRQAEDQRKQAEDQLKVAAAAKAEQEKQAAAQAAAEARKRAEAEVRAKEAEWVAQLQRRQSEDRQRAAQAAAAKAEQEKTAREAAAARAGQAQQEAERQNAEARNRAQEDAARIAATKADQDRQRTEAAGKAAQEQRVAEDARAREQHRVEQEKQAKADVAAKAERVRQEAERRVQAQQQRDVTTPKPAEEHAAPPPAAVPAPSRPAKVNSTDAARDHKVRRWHKPDRKPHRRHHQAPRCSSLGAEATTAGWYRASSSDTLWGIAERHYGAGRLYRRIYSANRHRLRDPDVVRPCLRLYIPPLTRAG